MKEVVGIQFRSSSRLYYFSPEGISFSAGDHAVVETIRGIELGKIVIKNRMVEDDEVQFELKPVMYKATKEEVEKFENNLEKAKQHFEVFKRLAKSLDLEMKPLFCEYTFDGDKLLCYYTSENRVDFRELLKLLASELKTRIELRQIGARDAAKIVGGIGQCGQIVCCKKCLTNFDFVTMKMAKDQNMTLNVNKISGICGKLECCIGYEHELYLELKKQLPKVGQFVKTPNVDAAKVTSIDYMKQIVSVVEDMEFPDVIKRYKSSELIYLCESNPMEEPEVEDVQTSVDLEPVIQKPKKIYNSEDFKSKKKKNERSN